MEEKLEQQIWRRRLRSTSVYATGGAPEKTPVPELNVLDPALVAAAAFNAAELPRRR